MRRTAFNDGWQFRPNTNRFAEMVGQGAEWEPVTLPHDAMISLERSPDGAPAAAYFPGGKWEYRKEVDLPAEAAGTAIVLELEGVYRDAVVQVNGVRAAHWAYGYSLVQVPIEHLVRFGETNEIRVECRAGDDSRWYSGGGIHRNVWLLEGGPLHLGPDGLDIRTPAVDDEGAVVTVVATVRNRSATTAVTHLRCEVTDADGRVVAADEGPVTTFPGDELTVRRRLFVSEPRRWGPDDPYLYSCRVTLLDGDAPLDEAASTFGVRTIAVDPKRGLRINGESVLLRGACVHHDNGPLGAATLDRAEERRVELLKAAGFNSIRSSHNPMSPAMLDACDRLGVLVMDETFDMWTEPKTDHDHALRFTESWEADVESMVQKDRNHPSVILYSIGNEVPSGSNPEGLHVARALTEKVRALDDTRLVTQAISGIMVGGREVFADLFPAEGSDDATEEAGINTTMTSLGDIMNRAVMSPAVTGMTTEAFSHLDVAGYNYMHLRFEKDGEDFPQRVIVSTESHPSPEVDDEWRGVLENPHVIGEFTWTGWDYIGEVGIGRVEYGEASGLGMTGFHGAHPWVTAWCGDIDITGRRRPQSFYREIVFGLRSEPYLAVQAPDNHERPIAHSSPWSFDDVVASWDWPGDEGAAVTVDVYADADEVELLVNDRSVGRSAADAKHRFRFRFETVYEPGRLEAVAWRDGKELGRTTLASPTGEVRLAATADRSEIRAGATDAAFVALALVDGAGTVWTSTDRTVRVEVDGPGVLQGLASVNPMSDERFTGDRCTTFQGGAVAVVRPTGAGTITLTATADGCPPQTITIEAK